MSRYCLSGNWITSNTDKMICGNRPVYCSNTYTSMLAGDSPVIRLTNHTKVFGTLYFYVRTSQNKRKYLHEFDNIKFFYKPNIVKWIISDSKIPQTYTITTGVPENAEGYLLKVESDKRCNLYYSYKDFFKLPLQAGSGENGWNISVILNPEIKEPFLDYLSEKAEINCNENTAEISVLGEKIFFRAPEKTVIGCENHELNGKLEISEIPVYFSDILNSSESYGFESVIRRSESLSSRFESVTPDKALDMAFKCISSEIDGAWKSPLTDHGNSAYSEPLLGWCNRFGNALGGWYDRCFEELKYFAAKQSKSDKKRGFSSNKKHLETIAGHNSRFYGKGHIGKYQHMYNMQSQFFDQMIFAWRMSGDGAMGKILYKALKLHTRWQDECFDPDNDGLYESYINSWPTDSVWYNGGGSCEETCYAYRSHLAAMELAAKYGDTEEFDFHKKILERIKKGFFEKLWLKSEGYPAMVREKGFYERLHKSAWLYNCFLPVDVGITDALQSATCLWYSKWGLENVKQELGGRMVWMSNWVPSIWSVRKMTSGENLQLSYAFFKAGFADEGYDLLLGASLSGAYNEEIPAHTSSEGASLLARAVICGLHGYEPDYPNKSVKISPHYPEKWECARINTSYFKARYKRQKNRIEYAFELADPADVTLNIQLPVCETVSVVGTEEYVISPGFSSITVSCHFDNTARREITVDFYNVSIEKTEITVNAIPGQEVLIPIKNAVSLIDTQGIVAESKICNEALSVKSIDVSGSHILFAECNYAGNYYYRLIRLELSDTAAEAEKRSRAIVDTSKANFEMLPISKLYNGAIQKIFKQKYVSPFNDINRLSIGTDGYSPWTFTFWNKRPPNIELKSDYARKNTVYSDDGIPFCWNGTDKNIAFTSLWNNWPSEICFPVNRAASAIHFLVAGSTNPMQCEIANAELEVRYASGITERIELVNPENFWSVCGYSGAGQVSDQSGVDDYSYETDAFCLPEKPPKQIILGNNCRACVLSYKLLPDTVDCVILRTLSQEVVIGLCAMTLQK